MGGGFKLLLQKLCTASTAIVLHVGHHFNLVKRVLLLSILIFFRTNNSGNSRIVIGLGMYIVALASLASAFYAICFMITAANRGGGGVSPIDEEDPCNHI